jgi:2-polyprenyl-6-methoxyphenol hydroxylase-like FAD-dependent oxidoreductase
MPQHVLIVGGGVGGTIVANILARRRTTEKQSTMVR